MIDDVAWDNIWPVITLLAGIVLTRVDDRRRERDLRAQDAAERRRAMERETSAELQDLLPELGKLTRRDLQHLEAEYRKRGGFEALVAANVQPVDERRDELNTRAQVLASRIAEDDLRHQVEAVLVGQRKLIQAAATKDDGAALEDILAEGMQLDGTVAQLGRHFMTVL